MKGQPLVVPHKLALNACLLQEFTGQLVAGVLGKIMLQGPGWAYMAGRFAT
jgi:hypothetical protein